MNRVYFNLNFRQFFTRVGVLSSRDSCMFLCEHRLVQLPFLSQ